MPGESTRRVTEEQADSTHDGLPGGSVPYFFCGIVTVACR